MSRKHFLLGSIFIFCGALFDCSANTATEAQELAIKLQPTTSTQWALLSKTATITAGELILDGRDKQSMALLKHQQWSDLTLTAKFLVEPASEGVLACGFVFRGNDDRTYYSVHFDRTQAILFRSSIQNSWHEIQRVRGLEKPAGDWHQASVSALENKIRVTLNEKLLFEASDNNLSQGHIGFYANQGIAHVKDILVSGSAQPSAKEFTRTEPLRFVVEDAGAGGYEAFPDVCRLKDGRLMCVYYSGYAHVSLPDSQHPRGGRISCSFSSDEGRTWSPPNIVYDGPHDDRDPSIVQLPNGTLLCNFFSLRPTKQSDKPISFQGSFVITSTDQGETWSSPVVINRRHACSSPIRILKNGRLILGMYGEYDGVAYGGVVQSTDQGKNWSDLIELDNQGAYLDAETDVIQLQDGSLYAALRGGKGAPLHWSRSQDGGTSWTPCQPSDFPAHCPYLHRAADGTILLAHRLPATQDFLRASSTSIRYSRDECQTWSQNVLVDSSPGAYPSLVNLRDDSVLIVFYEEGAQSNIRVRRLRTTEQGITWLGFE